MTQDERWLVRYEEVMGFVELKHQNLSKHRIEEHDMLNWLKANRKEDECWGVAGTKARKVQGIVGIERAI